MSISEYSEKLFSTEAEKAVIGSVIFNPGSRYDVDLTPDDFFIERHRNLWQSILELDDTGTVIDVLTLSERSNVELNYLLALTNMIVSSCDISDHARIIKEKAYRRRVFDTANALVRAAHSESDGIETEVYRIIDSLSTTTHTGEGAVHISAFTGQVMSEFEERMAEPKDIWGMQTGFIDYDNLTGGLQQSESVILSGEPGIGKSLLAMQMGMQLAGHGHPGTIYSIEMLGTAVARRMISSRSKVSTRKIKTGRANTAEHFEIDSAKRIIDNLPIFLSERAELDLFTLRADLARLKRYFGIKWFVVDYLFFMNAGKNLNEIEATTLLSRGIKRICKSLNLAGISIHSMNKEGINAATAGKTALRGSGQVAYDADLICILSKDKITPNVFVFDIIKGRELESDSNSFTLVKQRDYPFFGNSQRIRL
jgi:replicative DNA helicase